MFKGIRNAILKIFKLRNRKNQMLFVGKQKRSHRVDYSAMVKGHKAKKY